VSLKQAREALQLPVFWRIPNDYPTVLSSINEGTPFVLSSPKTEIAKSVRQLSETVSRALVQRLSQRERRPRPCFDVCCPFRSR